MPNASASRFEFIGHALRGDGLFRPQVVGNGFGADAGTTVVLSGPSALVRYPRESALKFARRNEVAYYSSPVMRACSRFVGYLATKPPQREIAGPDLYAVMAADIDGKGTPIDVFWQHFMVDFKARGTMLLQVDMPADLGANQEQQRRERLVPKWISIAPELVTDYQIGDDGAFDFVVYSGEFEKPEGERVPCLWRFDRNSWKATDLKQERTFAEGEHPLKACPVLIVTEGAEFPSFGPFSAIADLSRRLFNAESELDEILRAQTFSLLHLAVPEGSSDTDKIAAAKVAGETIGTNNLLIHTGSAPGFIAPPDGPARVYLDRIKQLKADIAEAGLDVATIGQQESGLAMRMRFAQINAELSSFAGRMEGLERRAWAISALWLTFSVAPTVQWTRDFNLADVEQELRILTEMQGAAMPAPVIAHQQKRIVSVQFAAMEEEDMAEITAAIDERTREPRQPAPT